MILRRLLLTAIAVLSLPLSLKAQGGNTTVTATITDSSNNLYTNSQVSISFYDPGTSHKLPLLNGSTFQVTYTGYATNSSGVMPPISLADNGAIGSGSGATGTQWIFNVCFSNRVTCFQTKITIDCANNLPTTCTANTIDISAALKAASAPLPTVALPASLSGNNAFSGNNTHSGTETFNQLNGCQYVNANQTFAQALVAASNPGCIEVTPGTYTVAATATIPYGVVLVSKSGGILSIATAQTLSIAGSIMAPPNTQIFAYVGTGKVVVAQGNVEALWFPGANLGVQVNNAALALNSAKAGGNTNGAGKIHIQAGIYSVPLGVMNPQADVILSCDENQSTAISFTGGSGIALLFNVGTAGGTYYEWGQGIENCQIYGPGWPSGAGQAGTGIQIGDGTHATLGLKVSNSFIAGFTLGMGWGTNPNSWGAKLDHTVFTLNTQDFVYNPNNGGGTENLYLDHIVFAPSYSAVIANDVVIGGGTTVTDLQCNNCSFDNAQLVITGQNTVALTKPHFEYNTATTTTFVTVSSGAFVSMHNPYVQFDPSAGAVPASVFSVNASTLDLYSPKMNSNFAITNYLNATNSATRVWGIEQLNGIGGPTYSGGWHIECGTTTQSCIYALGTGAFTVAASSGIALQNDTAVTGKVTATGTFPEILGLSGASGSSASLEVGRTASEHRFAAVAAVSGFFSDAVAGDLAVRTDDSTKRLRFGAGSSNHSGLIVGNGFFGANETTAPSASATDDLCYGDSTAHALECSYNNGTFGVVPLLNRAQTWSAAQTHTGAAIIPDQTSGITGTTTNNNANTGAVGEYVQSVLATGSSVTLATGVTSNVTSISLTAGDWDVTGAVDFTFGATTSYTNLIGSVSSTSATIGGQDSKFDFETPAVVPTAGADVTFSVPVVRFSLSGTTTVFLVAQGTFTVSTLKGYGTIRARRVR